MNYHVLFNEENGPVQECYIETESADIAEQMFIQRHPKAVYWEIGIPDLAA